MSSEAEWGKSTAGPEEVGEKMMAEQNVNLEWTNLFIIKKHSFPEMD